VRYERPFTDDEIAMLRRRLETTSSGSKAKAVAKLTLWAIGLVAACLGTYVAAVKPIISSLEGAAPILLIVTIIGFLIAVAEVSFVSHKPSPTYIAETQEILADGYAIVETFSPIRVASFEWDVESGDTYVMDVGDNRVVFCIGDWPDYESDDDEADEEPDDQNGGNFCWPNSRFRLTRTRLHCEFLGIELLGRHMDVTQEIRADGIDDEKVAKYVDAINIYGNRIAVLDGSIESVLANCLKTRDE
jgi:hypothetical protein